MVAAGADAGHGSAGDWKVEVIHGSGYGVLAWVSTEPIPLNDLRAGFPDDLVPDFAFVGVQVDSGWANRVATGFSEVGPSPVSRLLEVIRGSGGASRVVIHGDQTTEGLVMLAARRIDESLAIICRAAPEPGPQGVPPSRDPILQRVRVEYTAEVENSMILIGHLADSDWLLGHVGPLGDGLPEVARDRLMVEADRWDRSGAGSLEHRRAMWTAAGAIAPTVSSRWVFPTFRHIQAVGDGMRIPNGLVAGQRRIARDAWLAEQVHRQAVRDLRRVQDGGGLW